MGKGWLIAWAWVLITAGAAVAQMPDSERDRSGAADLFFFDQPDTMARFRFHALSPYEEVVDVDTGLHQTIQQYDPARQREVDFATLGNTGSAARPIRYKPPARQGFDVGLRAYDLYMTPLDSMPYYRLGRAYTKLFYAQGAQQTDGYLKAKFSRNFEDRVNLSIDYKRMSQLGDRNQFPNQNARNTALDVGVWVRTKSERYQAFLAFVANTVEQENNGGLLEEPAVGEDFSSPQSAIVFLNEAQTRYDFRDYGYTHHFRFTNPQKEKAVVLATHQLRYGTRKYKFSDPDLLNDTAFYPRYPQFVVDVRGNRMYMEQKQLENQVHLSFFSQRGGDNYSPKKPAGLLKAGIKHTVHWLEQSPVDTAINNLFLLGEGSFSLSDRLEVQAYGHFGLWDNAGDYQVKGDLNLGLGPIGQFYAGAVNELYSPTWVQSYFSLTNQEVWRNDFAKTLHTKLHAGIRIPKIRFKAEAAYQLFNNHIYFDSTASPQQFGGAISLLQLTLRQDFKLWDFHLDNTLVYQASSEDVIRVPQLFGKHSLYYRGIWFRVLRVKVGFDLRYMTSYFPDYYHPVIGQFILQNQREAEFYPSVDGYFVIRVTKFRAFLKWENMERLFVEDQFFYQSGFYPVPTGPGIRFGISWRFEN